MIVLKSTLKILSACSWSSVSLRSPRYFSDGPEPYPLRSKKKKSSRTLSTALEDSHVIKTIGGKGGDGCISFLQSFCNDKGGPDGGNGGNGGHVIFRASKSKSDLRHLSHMVKADDGERGYNRDCCGKNAKHYYVDVPLGTIIKNSNGVIVGDLDKEGMMFVAARGGCGGNGNHFFATDVNQSPQVAEEGAMGETVSYMLEIKSMAHFGLVGLPNAGKSTLLRAISRARPEVAGYEFTTLRPYIGVVTFSDYEQIYVADLPGLIKGSHQNKGLGITFLKHTERCLGLLYVIDMSRENPLSQLDVLKHELSSFSKELVSRPSVLVANKMDLEEAQGEYLTHLLFVDDVILVADSPESPQDQINQLQVASAGQDRMDLTKTKIMFDDYIDREEDLRVGDATPETANLRKLETETDHKFIPISAKMGKNLSYLLRYMRKFYDDVLAKDKSREDEEGLQGTRS